jgi:hypothetical protein
MSSVSNSIATMPNEAALSANDDIIRSLILTMRGVQVILDRDIAKLYGVETKVLNQAVKRNRERFPDRFMFRLTGEDIPGLRSQIVTLNKGQGAASHARGRRQVQQAEPIADRKGRRRLP